MSRIWLGTGRLATGKESRVNKCPGPGMSKTNLWRATGVILTQEKLKDCEKYW